MKLITWWSEPSQSWEKSLLKSIDIPTQLNDQRKFDHEIFIPMKLISLDADIPVMSTGVSRGKNIGGG